MSFSRPEFLHPKSHGTGRMKRRRRGLLAVESSCAKVEDKHPYNDSQRISRNSCTCYDLIFCLLVDAVLALESRSRWPRTRIQICTEWDVEFFSQPEK